MKPRLPQYCLFISLFIFGLTSCSAQKITNSPAGIESGTSIITETPAQSTPTPSPTITPQPTLSPTAQNTPVFLYPNDWNMSNATPTAIQTPDTRSIKYRLRTWTENDAIALVDTMDQYALKMDIHGLMLSRPDFENAQEPVELLLQETINRFPESVNINSYKWHLARARAIQGSKASDDWIISSLENEIQSGRVTADSVNDFLVPNGFFAVSKEANNLFGDGKKAWVLQVTVNAGYKRDGIFMVVRGDQKSEYKIYSLGSYWSFTNSYSEIYDFGDYNNNGSTEVLVKIGFHSGSECSSNMLIFEWDGQKFSDISGGHVYYDHCGGSFSITSSTNKGPSKITTVLDAQHINQFKYIWNGTEYEWIREVSPNYIEVWTESDSRRTHSYTREIEAIKGFLNSDAIKKDKSSFPDYLRYRLGVNLAMESRREEALSEFNKIIAEPTAPSFTLIPRMAKLFHELYKDDKSLYTACLSTNNLFNNSTEFDTRYRIKSIKKINGIDMGPAVFLNNIPLCDLDKALDLTLKTTPPETGNIISYITSLGVEIKFQKQVDLNLDGRDEWILHLGDGYWVVVYNIEGKYFAKPLFESTYTFFEKLEQFSVLKIPGNNRTFFTFDYGDWFAVMEIDKNYEITQLIHLYSPFNIKTSQIDGNPIFQLYPNRDLSEYPGEGKWIGYRWNDKENNFSNDLLEYELFDLHKPEIVLNTFTDLVPPESNINQLIRTFYDPDYNYYLAALSAELSGQLDKAVELYLQLWKSFPDSPYAIMARDKLEPVTP